MIRLRVSLRPTPLFTLMLEHMLFIVPRVVVTTITDTTVIKGSGTICKKTHKKKKICKKIFLIKL